MQEERHEPRENVEQPPSVHVTLSDFKAGHHPGLKLPPLGLNELFQMDHPDLDDRARAACALLEPGGESATLFSVIFDNDGKQEVIDVKVFKPAHGGDMMYLRGYPRSPDLYEIEED